NQAGNSSQSAGSTQQAGAQEIDYSKVKPNEAGQIMVVMFHNFVETYPKGKNDYTTTFSEFDKLLNDLYQKKYRLEGNILCKSWGGNFQRRRDNSGQVELSDQ
ncbi:MAG TPA: hypothetical protein VHP38_04415, partial [Ruminiclostridium sp.]|nr:hypothetical protein [Ruminiclostridium sp.]